MLRRDPEIELRPGLRAQAPMLVLVMGLASHRQVPGVMLTARPVVARRLDVMDLCGPGTADLAAARSAGTGSVAGR